MEIKDMFECYSINSEPVYSLAECIAAKPHEDTENEDIEGCGDPVAAIKEHFRANIYLCDMQQLDFLKLAAKLTEKKSAWEENIAYYPFWIFYFGNFVYLFSRGSRYDLVLPNELAEILHEVISEEKFAVIHARNLELSAYASALLNLYGVYEMEQYVTVWNHHHKDKITFEEAETILSDREDFKSDFYLYDGFVVHDCIDEDEFEDLWTATEGVEYYMPTKSVIREYANRDYNNLKIPGEKEMDDFLAAHITNPGQFPLERDLEELQFEIMESCVRLKSPLEVKGLLDDINAPLNDGTFCSTFERLYNTLRDNTHIWELKGFTPFQYENKTGRRVREFKLPKVKTNIKHARKRHKNS